MFIHENPIANLSWSLNLFILVVTKRVFLLSHIFSMYSELKLAWKGKVSLVLINTTKYILERDLICWEILFLVWKVTWHGFNLEALLGLPSIGFYLSISLGQSFLCQALIWTLPFPSSTFQNHVCILS